MAFLISALILGLGGDELPAMLALFKHLLTLIA
jgi:hypothetical protein